jgi:N-acetylglucosamine kinase-like BadF-type ATPase
MSFSSRTPVGPVVLAIDGGNVKTDLALVDAGGRLLSLVRGGRSSPHYLGLDGTINMLEDLLAEAVSRAGLDPNRRPQADAAQVMIAGADLPEELAALRAQIESLAWSERLSVDNDTLALLRSGTDRGWGVAVVCGGGINCVGRAPDGRDVRFPSLGAITGDWGGGHDVGMAALMAAARSEDGRGPKTILESAVPAYFGLTGPFDVGRALHLGHIAQERVGELSRVVFAVCDDDPVATEIVFRMCDEVVAFARATLRRLDLTESDADVVLGGGLMRAAPAIGIERIVAGVHEIAPAASVRLAPTAPIVGAALMGLDELGVNSEAADRVREQLYAAFLEIEGDGSRVARAEPSAIVTNG